MMNQASALPAAMKRRLPVIPGVEWPRPATDAHRATFRVESGAVSWR